MSSSELKITKCLPTWTVAWDTTPDMKGQERHVLSVILRFESSWMRCHGTRSEPTMLTHPLLTQSTSDRLQVRLVGVANIEAWKRYKIAGSGAYGEDHDKDPRWATSSSRPTADFLKIDWEALNGNRVGYEQNHSVQPYTNIKVAVTTSAVLDSDDHAGDLAAHAPVTERPCTVCLRLTNTLLQDRGGVCLTYCRGTSFLDALDSL